MVLELRLPRGTWIFSVLNLKWLFFYVLSFNWLHCIPYKAYDWRLTLKKSLEKHIPNWHCPYKKKFEAWICVSVIKSNRLLKSSYRRVINPPLSISAFNSLFNISFIVPICLISFLMSFIRESYIYVWLQMNSQSDQFLEDCLLIF